MKYEGQVKKSVTVALKSEKYYKKIFKILFSKNDPDFYVSVPYFNSDKFYAGQFKLKPEDTATNINAITSGKKTASKFLKISFHKDGQTHFKYSDNLRQNIDPSLKLCEIKTTPLKELRGIHILTVQFEGIEMFDNCTEKSSSNNIIVAGKLNDKLRLTKFTVYIGQKETEVSDKYGSSINPLIRFTLKRKNLTKPLFIAVYQGEGGSIQCENESNDAYILALTGFKKNIDNSLEALYLYGKGD